MQKGDKVIFGEYKWRILDVQSDRSLIMTENIIEQRPYHKKMMDTTWENCGLRKYLNNEFLDRFKDEDKERILLIENKNISNPWYGTNGGENTQDYVFLLDIEDVVCRYFGDSSRHLQNRKPTERYWFHKKDENSIKRMAKLDGHGYWWWLRSPGRNNRNAVYIHNNGCVGINGNSVFFRTFGAERDGGVRPALWLSL